MPHIVQSTVIGAPPDRVWTLLRDFSAQDRWNPAVTDIHMERGRSADRVGCVRTLRLRDGSSLREQLLALSDADMAYSYCLLETPVPLLNCTAHVHLAPITDGERTFWHWECRFDAPAGEEAQLCRFVADNIQRPGFAAMEQHFSKGAA